MREEATVFVAVARAVFVFHGARSLKDRRRVLRSLRDRVRQRFEVGCHELIDDVPSRGALVITTASGDQRAASQALDRVRAFLVSDPRCVVASFECDVMPWSGGDSSLNQWAREFDV